MLVFPCGRLFILFRGLFFFGVSLGFIFGLLRLFWLILRLPETRSLLVLLCLRVCLLLLALLRFMLVLRSGARLLISLMSALLFRLLLCSQVLALLLLLFAILRVRHRFTLHIRVFQAGGSIYQFYGTLCFLLLWRLALPLQLCIFLLLQLLEFLLLLRQFLRLLQPLFLSLFPFLLQLLHLFLLLLHPFKLLSLLQLLLVQLLLPRLFLVLKV